MAVASLLAGADGLVPGEANIYPRLLADLLTAVRQGDLAMAFDCETKIGQYMPIQGWKSIHALKLLGKALGLMSDRVISPLPRLEDREGRRVIQIGASAGLPIPASWLE